MAALAGCSVHPIPDDVSPIPTEDIVRSARCEMRLGVFDQVKDLIERAAQVNKVRIAPFDVKDLLTEEGRRRVLPAGAIPADLGAVLKVYGKVAIAYDFDFQITENDDLDASLAFKLPFATSPNGFDLGAAGSLHRTRVGKRTFSAQETFEDLILRVRWCDGFEVRRKNHLYPITGSIGLRQVMNTFVALSEQGGGKDSFVDTLTFTTTVGGSVGPSLKFKSVPHSFRLVSAGATAAAGRTDLHKVTISLAFPVTPKPKKNPFEEGVGPGEAGAPPYVYNPVWRARYNICVADARNREDSLKTLRLTAPEVYCVTYADTFVPRTGAAASLVPQALERFAPQSGPSVRSRGRASPPPSSRAPSWW
jgi:hypothetical protein